MDNCGSSTNQKQQQKKRRRNENYLEGWEFMEAYIRIMTAHHPDDMNF